MSPKENLLEDVAKAQAVNLLWKVALVCHLIQEGSSGYGARTSFVHS